MIDFDLKKYAEKASRTAVFPEEQAVYYLALGLVDEAEELKSSYKTLTYSNESKSSMSDLNAICKEAGDVLWYTAMLARELDVIDNITEKRQTIQGELDDYFDDPKDRPQGIWSLAGKVIKKDKESLRHTTEFILSKAARLCGKIKKVMRDHNGDFSVKKDTITNSLDNILYNINTFAFGAGLINIGMVANKNIEKLSDRQDRGVLKGSGDNR